MIMEGDNSISYPEQCMCAGQEGIGSGEIEFFLCCDWLTFIKYQIMECDNGDSDDNGM